MVRCNKHEAFQPAADLQSKSADVRPIPSVASSMMCLVEKQTRSLPTDLYRHRYAFDRLKRAALHGSNQLGMAFVALVLPPEFEPMKKRLNSSQQILKKALRDLKASKIDFQANLPLLPAELLEALRGLDQRLVACERSACHWLLSNRRVPDTEADGNWICFGQSIWMRFQFDSELDPESAEVTELHLDWRFPFVECRLADEAHRDRCMSPSLFRFGQWADDHDPVDRPEISRLESEFLKAFLPHVPEIAFLASYVLSCTLTLDRGREWHAPLSRLNTDEEPAFQR